MSGRGGAGREDGLLAAADRLAEASHAGQTRKGTERPYVEHPREVARLLREAGASEPLVAAGLLHDVVEDTAVTLGELRRAFGDEVAELVAAVSEDKARTWEERKRGTIVELREAPPDVLLLKAADALANASGAAGDGAHDWAPFRRPYPLQRRYYRAVAAVVEAHAGDGPLGLLAGRLRAAVDRAFPPDPELDLEALLARVHERATNLASRLHGEEHWRCVAATARDLHEHEPLADPLLGFLFGLLHDTMREHDGYDRAHGPRAAALAETLHAEGALPLADDALAELLDALARHADGEVSDRPTTGLCWDADRLHLPRVGTTPATRFLSSPLGDLGAAVARAEAVRAAPPGWDELYAGARRLA